MIKGKTTSSSSSEDNERDEIGGVDGKKKIVDLLFKVPVVKDPLIGTPKEVQKKLDKMAVQMRKKPNDHIANKIIFDKIHLYMHGFLINVCLKQFPYIRGFQTCDIYQESLIALRFKAINGFRMGKGMSFLNFAKMCIRRHLITILHASTTRLRDRSMNQSISLDVPCIGTDGESSLSNVIPDNSSSVSKQTELKEAYSVTLDSLYKVLSKFERKVLKEYLTSSSYCEIANDIENGKHNSNMTKSIDNALVRIRQKAHKLKKTGKLEDLPIFIN